MTLVLTLDEYRAQFDKTIDFETIKDLIVIVRNPDPKPAAAPAPLPTSWSFDDDDLITWEDAEWQ